MEGQLNLKGKKLLFIGIGFYDYDKLIIDKLSSHGVEVTYICQEHHNRIMSQFSKSVYFSFIEKRHSDKSLSDKLVDKIDFDYVFVIKGDRLTTNHIKMLRRNNSNAKFKLYQWDSLKRFEGDITIFELFDNVYSFDRIDCINNTFIFVPLFFRQKIKRKASYKFDVSFVGWMHFNRLDLLQNMSKKMSKMNLDHYFYLFGGVKNWFLYNLLRRIKYVHRKKMDYQNYTNVITEKNVILDFHHPDQDGLTIRTIEALGANSKIVTTNTDIKNYEFYNYNNVYILDESSNIDEIVKFITQDFNNIPNEVLDKYSMDAWLKCIFK